MKSCLHSSRFFVSLLLVCFLTTGCTLFPRLGSSTRTIKIKGNKLTVQVADTQSKRERGLMFVQGLSEREGMLFIFPKEETLVFWMKNTPLPLSVAFISQDKCIVDIQVMIPLREDRSYKSKAPAKYALEVQHDWFLEHDVKVGDKVEF